MATMSLHKATGPFSLYDTWKGNQPLLTNKSQTQETSPHKSTDNFFGHSASYSNNINLCGFNNLCEIFSYLKRGTFKTISAFMANISQHKVMFNMVAIGTW